MLFIAVDDLRPQLGVMGPGVRAPSMITPEIVRPQALETPADQTLKHQSAAEADSCWAASSGKLAALFPVIYDLCRKCV